MAKLTKEMILRVIETRTLFPVSGSDHVNSIKWNIITRPGCPSRTFETYGKDADKYNYPVEKLPKAVQLFVGEHSASHRVVGDYRVYTYE